METGLKLIFRALRHRNYRLFFGGQSISLIGTWMQATAMSWLVYRLTRSPFLLGAVGFASQIPTFVFAPIAGVVADRWNRRRILVITQSLAMVQALVLAFLVWRGAVAVWQVLLLTIFLGLVNAFDIPARQSFVVEMIERREDLGNAIALNSSMFNGARLVGPSIAGILIATAGERVCFLLNSVSYLPVIGALLAMRVTRRNAEVPPADVLHGLKEGFSYAFGSAPMRSVILLVALMNLLGASYHVLLPVFAREILHGGPHTLGFLVGAVGAGAFGGAIYLASRKSAVGLAKIPLIALSGFGIGLVAFSQSSVLWLSLPLLMLMGFGMMVQMASSNTVLQTVVDDDKRGRVMAFYTMAWAGTAPTGSLLAGSLAGSIGAPRTLLMGGLCCILGSVLFARKLLGLKEMPELRGEKWEALSGGVGTLRPN
jgi:MFS family permease